MRFSFNIVFMLSTYNYRVRGMKIEVKFEDRRVKEVEIKDVEELLNAPLNEIQMIKGGLTVESNLSELVEEVDLDTKIPITGNEVEIPVGRLVYDKLKGKKVPTTPHPIEIGCILACWQCFSLRFFSIIVFNCYNFVCTPA